MGKKSDAAYVAELLEEGLRMPDVPVVTADEYEAIITDMNAACNDALGDDARRAYYREWRAKNPEKVKAYRARYWAKKGAELIQREQQHRKAVL